MRLVLAGILLILAQLSAAQNIRFVAETDATSLVENAVFEVSYVLENAEGESFTPPDFSPFRIVAGPSRSMSTSIINGVVSRSMSYTYTLQAGNHGKFTIPPASMQVGGRTLRSNALLIEVVQSNAKGGQGGDIRMPEGTDVFLASELDTNILYPGQQVQLNYTLYSTLNVRNYAALSEDDYSKYYMRHVKDFNSRPHRVAINGIQYQSQILKSVALFPQQLGKDTIAPFVVRLGIGVQDPNNGFFFSLRTVPKNVSSSARVVEVKPLPPGPPASFTGAVGQYLMHVQIDKSRLSTDDALVLIMQIQGDGDARRWEAPPLDSLKDHFEIYAPKTIMDRSVDQSGIVINEKRFEYLLIPRNPGSMTFSVPFSYFDPIKGEYKSLYSDTFNIHVSQGSGTGDISERLALHREGSHNQLKGLKEITSLNRDPHPFFLSASYLALLSAPLLGLLFLFIVKRQKEEFAGKSKEEKKRLLASKLARRLLSEARKKMDGGDARAFYEAVSYAIIGYLAGKIGIPNSALNRDNINAKMESHGFSVDIRDRVMQLIEKGNLALYAGKLGESDLESHYQTASELFIDLESRFRD